jgi:hypothetical protein
MKPERTASAGQTSSDVGLSYGRVEGAHSTLELIGPRGACWTVVTARALSAQVLGGIGHAVVACTQTNPISLG